MVVNRGAEPISVDITLPNPTPGHSQVTSTEMFATASSDENTFE